MSRRTRRIPRELSLLGHVISETRGTPQHDKQNIALRHIHTRHSTNSQRFTDLLVSSCLLPQKWSTTNAVIKGADDAHPMIVNVHYSNCHLHSFHSLFRRFLCPTTNKKTRRPLDYCQRNCPQRSMPVMTTHSTHFKGRKQLTLTLKGLLNRQSLQHTSLETRRQSTQNTMHPPHGIQRNA